MSENSRVAVLEHIPDLNSQNISRTFQNIPDEGISGSGGGSQPKQPTVIDDSGRSTQKAMLVEALCDGKARIIDGLKGVYFDKTVVESPNGNRNFSGFSFRTKQGTPTQDSLKDFGDEVVADYPVNTLVKHEPGASIDQRRVTRTAINSQLTSIRVSLQIQLQRENGTKGDELRFIISTKAGNDGWKNRLDRTVTGKFANPVGFEYDISFANLGGTVDTFQVRIEKVTPDPDPDDDDDDGRLNALKWTSYAEVIKQEQFYANTCVVGLEFDPEQFDSAPERRYRVERLDVRIPTNATVVGRGRLDFSGSWDGTFYNPNVGVCDPAWILFDLFTDTRYGFGHKQRKIDIWKLYEMSRYNNQLVPDGFGGSHARYAIRTQIQTAEDEDRMLDLLCSAMHAKKYRANGKLTFWQDRPTDSTWYFTNADVADGQFIYSSTDVSSRFNSISCAWNDPDDYWRLSYETVEDQAGINRYGVQKTDLIVFGCNERGRAIRFGRWGLFSNLNETEIINFKPRAFGALVELGEVVEVQDNAFYTMRYGGLVVTANVFEVILDYPVNIPAGPAQIRCLLPTGKWEVRDIVGRGPMSSVITSTPFTAAPLPEANWMITTPDRPTTLWRIINKKPLTNDPTLVELQGILYFPEKSAYIERKVTMSTPTPPPIMPVTVTKPAAVGGGYDSVRGCMVVSVSFNFDPFTRSAIVQYSNDGFTWEGSRTITSTSPTVDYFNLPAGSYALRAVAVDLQGRQSEFTYSTVNVIVP